MTVHEVRKLPDRQLLPETLRVMAKGAREASQIYGLREWAARLATKARPRDYVGQLREIFNGVYDRSRYVMEPGEWVHGTGESLVRHVLGTKYNGDPDLNTTSLANIPSREKGWGDCDDMSQAVAACVLAIGMIPFFRVVRTGRGGHVSVVVKTPRGEVVSLDPVGKPEHPFGWMMPAPANQIAYYDMMAQPAPGLGKCDCPRRVNRTALLRAGQTFKQFPPMATHYVRSYPGMMPPNVLAVRQGGYLSSTECRDALSAVDEHGQQWIYNAGTDLWESPLSLAADEAEQTGLGDIDVLSGGNFWKGVKRRWKKRIKAVGRVVKKVREIHNKIVSKILSSKIGQKLVGAALSIWGVPPQVAPAIMTMAAEIIKKGGLIGFLKQLRRNPKMALRMVAGAAKKGLIATGLVPEKAKKFLSGMDDDETSLATTIGQEVVPVHPISAIIEVPLGAVDWQKSAKVPNIAAETQNTLIAVDERPAKSRGLSRGSGQSEIDWLTNVVLWETYPSAPVKLDSKNKSHKPYIDAWVRIKKSVKNGTAVKKTEKSSSTSAKPFAVNTSEGAIAREASRDRPATQNHAGSAQKQGAGQSDQDWLTNVAYWRAYPEGPTFLDSKNSGHKNYINAWRRLASMVKKEMAAVPTKKTSTPTKTTTPTKKTSTPTKTTTPTKKTSTPTTIPTTTSSSNNCWDDEIRKQSICEDVQINPEERAIAMAVADEKPRSETVHGTAIHQGTRPQVDWLANVAYWRAYPEGPIEIPGSAPQYAAAWNRLKAIVRSELGSSGSVTPKPKPQLPDTDVPDKNELPDLDPREMACLRSGGRWNGSACIPKSVEPPIEPPKKESNWFPLIAGAAALALMLKGG